MRPTVLLMGVLAGLLAVSPTNGQSIYDPRMVEGTVYAKSISDDIIKMSGAEVRLLDLKIIGELTKHLNGYEKTLAAAISEKLKELVDKTVSLLDNGESDLIQKIKVASEQILAGKERLDGALAAETRKVSELKMPLAESERHKSELLSELKRLEGIWNEQLTVVEHQQKEEDNLYEEQKTKVENDLVQSKALLEKRKIEKQDTIGKLTRERAQMVASIDAEIRVATDKVSQSERALKEQREKVALDLAASYARTHITVTNSDGGFSTSSRRCYQVLNNGNMAIISLTLDVFYKNKSLRDAGIKSEDLGDLFLEASSFKDKTIPTTINQYKEEINGISPKSVWPSERSCFFVMEIRIRGDIQRVFDSLGGFDARAPFRVAVRSVQLADPTTLKSRQKYGEKTWEFAKEAPLKVFQSEVEAATPKLPGTAILAQRRAELEEIRKKRVQEEAAKKLASDKMEKQLDAAISQANSIVSEAVARQQLAKQKIVRSAEMVQIEPLLIDVKRRLPEVLSRINSIQKEAATVSEIRTNEELKLKKINEEKSQLEAALSKLIAERNALRMGEGEQYLILKSVAEMNAGLTKTQHLWMEDLVKALEKAEGISVRADVDGKFRFSKVSRKEALLFSVAKYRRDSLFWLVRINLDITTLNDLGDHNKVIYEPGGRESFQLVWDAVKTAVADTK